MWRSVCQVKTRRIWMKLYIRGFREIRYRIKMSRKIQTSLKCRKHIFHDMLGAYHWRTRLLPRLLQLQNFYYPTMNKGTDFVNTYVQWYLKRQAVNFHTSHNPDIKWITMERFKMILKSKMYKDFKKNNTFRYLDIIGKLLTSYNSGNSTKSMSLNKVNPSNIYYVRLRMNSLRQC